MKLTLNLTIIIQLFLLIPSLAFAANVGWEPDEGLSYIYLTWEKENTSTHMTVNYHSALNYEMPQAFISEVPLGGDVSLYKKRVYGKTRSLSGIKRAFHRVTFNDLKPGAIYYFIVGDKNVGYSKEYSFKTLPNDGTPITFVTGGDMGARESVGKILKLAIDTTPDFVAIGGDIAYADGRLSKYKNWDIWLKMWTDNMINKNGHITPFTAAIGNHEVGFGSNSYERAPFFFALFEQGSVEKAHFYRLIGNDAVLYYLDTGHISSHFGPQKKWMKKTMKRFRGLEHQLAIYHIPLYPSNRKYKVIPSRVGRKSWINTFDKYKIDLAFENHDHTFKVTHPLKDGQIVAPGEGTIYIGDGCWGRSPRSSHPERWYLEEAGSKVHFWHVTLDGKNRKYEAIGENNETLYRSN